MPHSNDNYLSTAAMCRATGAHHRSELFAAAEKLGMAPGVVVVTDTGEAIVKRTWDREWAEEIKKEIDRLEGETFDPVLLLGL